MATLDTNGVTLHYETHGDGPPLLAMGGWGTFCHDGWGELPRRVTSSRTIIAFDLPGVESSVDPSTEPLTTHRVAAMAIDLLDHLGTGPAEIVGIMGMGGCVAQWIAIERPDLVQAMVLSGCWAHVDAHFSDVLRLLADTMNLGGFEMYQLYAGSMSFTPEFWEANRHRVLGPDGAWKHLNGKPELVARLVHACRTHDAIGRLPEITAPTLVLHGEQDILTPPRLTRAIEAGIPGAIGESWSDMAHLPAGRDQKLRFNDLVGDFLDAHR
jgi:3-oxoadipate enol-lactonase